MIICNRCGTGEGKLRSYGIGLAKPNTYENTIYHNPTQKADLCDACAELVAKAVVDMIAPIRTPCGPVIERVIMPPRRVGWFNWLVTLLSAVAGGVSLWMTLKR